MKHLISCEFNIDTACVELVFADGTVIVERINLIAFTNKFKM